MSSPTDTDPDNQIRDLVRDIVSLEHEKSVLTDDIKERKEAAYALGYTKSALAEALRLAKQDDEARNLILTGANKILEKIGRAPINTNAQVF